MPLSLGLSIGCAKFVENDFCEGRWRCVQVSEGFVFQGFNVVGRLIGGRLLSCPLVRGSPQVTKKRWCVTAER